MVKKRFFSFFLAIIAVVFLDQLTKYIVKNQIIKINFTTNTGSLFGLFQNSAVLLIWLSIIIIGVFLYNLDKIQKSNIYIKISSGLIIGGAIGNLIDRIFYKAVIDFIDLGWWPSFNIADSAISVGVVMLIISLLIEDEKKVKIT